MGNLSCPSCGENYNDRFRFCPRCGFKNPIDAPVREIDGRTVIFMPVDEKLKDKRKSKIKLKAALITLCIAIVLLILFHILVLIKSQ